MKSCSGGLQPLFYYSLLNPLKGHLSISVFTKGPINDLANPALNAEPHLANLITQRRMHKLQYLALLSLLHASE